MNQQTVKSCCIDPSSLQRTAPWTCHFVRWLEQTDANNSDDCHGLTPQLESSTSKDQAHLTTPHSRLAFSKTYVRQRFNVKDLVCDVCQYNYVRKRFIMIQVCLRFRTLHFPTRMFDRKMRLVSFCVISSAVTSMLLSEKERGDSCTAGRCCNT